MSLERALEQDSDSTKSISFDVKITATIEKVLLLLVLACCVSNKWSATGYVKYLIQVTGKTPKTIGSVLKWLVEKEIISYTKEGRERRIALNLQNEFVQELLIIFTSFSQEEQLMPNKLVSNNFGLFPSNLDFNTFEDNLTKMRNQIEEETQFD